MSLGRERGTIDIQRTQGGFNWVWLIVGLIVLGLIAWALYEAFDRDQPATAPPTAGPQAAATINNIVTNPSEFMGRTVTVSGEVGEVIGPRAFTIGEPQELLVVGANELPTIAQGTFEGELTPDRTVQVTGPVRTFDLAQVEQEIGFDLDDNLFANYAGRPAIVAQSMNVSPAPTAAGTPGTQDVPVTISMIADNPSEFMGQNVTVTGVVTDIINESAFTLRSAGGTGNEVVVAGAANMIPSISEGNQVQVSGTVRQFDLQEFETALNADWNDNLFADWTDRPAIMANNVSMQPGQTGQMGQPGTQPAQPGTTQPGIGQPGTGQPGTMEQPGTTMQPGTQGGTPQTQPAPGM